MLSELQLRLKCFDCGADWYWMKKPQAAEIEFDVTGRRVHLVSGVEPICPSCGSVDVLDPVTDELISLA